MPPGCPSGPFPTPMVPAPPPPPGPPRIADELLFVPCISGQLLALHTTNGSVAWQIDSRKYPNDENMLSPVTFVDGILYATWTWHFRALDPVTGHVLWSHNYTGIRVDTSQPAVGGGRAVIVNADGVMFCYDAYNGTFLWTQSGLNPSYSQAGGDQTSLPSIASDGNTYARDRFGFLWALNGSDGSVIWKTNEHYMYGQVSSTATFSEDESVLYVVWSCFMLVALDRGTGKVLRTVPFSKEPCYPVSYGQEQSMAPIVYDQTFILVNGFYFINVTMVGNTTELTQRSFCTMESEKYPRGYFGDINQTPARDRSGGFHFCAINEMAAMESNGTMRYYKHIVMPGNFFACYGTVLDSAGRPYFMANNRVGLAVLL